MQTVSRQQNQHQWTPKGVKLRTGQYELYQAIRNNPKPTYSIQLPTGYGKSWCACIAYATLRSMGQVDRCLIVVPTDQQRSQYIDGLADDLATLSIPVKGIDRCDNQSGWVIKNSLQNKAEIFVAGIGSICAAPGYYRDLMGKGRWLVVADEFHHYGEENTWGKAVLGLSYQVILGMSATPFRNDKTKTIFGDTDFDVQVSVPSAYEENAIKRVEARIGDYAVSWSTMDDPEPHSSLMSELMEEWPSDISAYEIKRGVRYHSKYVSEIFHQVLTAWNEYEAQWPGQNQILVFAMSCAHAEQIADLINKLAFPGYPEPFADWIGVGQGETKKRSDKENAEILGKFQDNQLPCLVQVNKASEGFNNKRCSIGLFLDLVGDTPMKRQHIGRFMRVNPSAPGQSSLIFVSEDSPCRSLLEGLEETFDEADGITKSERKQRREHERDAYIPDLVIIDTAFESERIVYPFGSPEAAIAKFLEDEPKAAELCEGMPEAERKQVLQEIMDDWLKAESRRKLKPLTSEQRRDQVVKQVSRALGVVVSKALSLRYGKSYPSSVRNDLYRIINSQWKRVHGSGHSDMTEADLRAKHSWLKSLAQEMNQRGLPAWLNR